MFKLIIYIILFSLGCFQSLAQNPNFEWVKPKGGTNYDYGRSIAIGSSGNIYTTGFFSGTVDFNPGAGTINFTASGTHDIFVQKLDSDGNLLWAKQIGGNNTQQCFAIIADDSENIYITGYFSGTVDFDPGSGISLLSSNGLWDMFILKLNSDGNFVWAKQTGGTNPDIGYTLALDNSNNIYTVGWFHNTVDFDPGPGINNLTSTGSFDAYIQKLDSNGTFIWAKQITGSNQKSIQSIAIDSQGYVYTTGTFKGTTDFDPGTNTSFLTSNGNEDIFVQKLDSNGNFIWVKHMGGAYVDYARSMHIGSFGNLYITGQFRETVDFDPGVGVSNLTTVLDADIYIQKLTSDGDLVWVKQLGGLMQSSGFSIITDQNENVYTTGNFQGTVDFDPGVGITNLTSYGDRDCFISKLDSSGNFTWVKQLGGTLRDECFNIALDSLNSIYTTGTFEGISDFDPESTTFNASSTGGFDLFVHKFSQCNPINLEPEIELLPELTYSCSIDSLPPPTATNSCETIIGTTSTIFPINNIGTTTITWVYSDGSGNSITQNQNIIITEDTINPTPNLTYLPDITNQCYVNSITAPLAYDNCSGTIEASTNIIFPITVIGTTTITWTFNDGNGNTTTQNQNIIITEDTTSPNPNVPMLNNLSAECRVDTLIAPYATDNCTGSVLGYPNVTLPITTQGTTVITWTYNDGNGNIATQYQNVFINDNIHPEPEVLNLPDIEALCIVTAIDVPVPIATDNCLGQINGIPNLVFPIIDQSINQISWTYNDGNGNIIIQDQNINWGNIDVSTSQIANTITANNSNATYQWLDCENNLSPLFGETNQSLSISINGSYCVELTEDNCIDTSECISIDKINLDEFESDIDFTLYPNPFTSILNITFKNPPKSVKITVSDILGKLISKKTIKYNTKTSIDLRDLHSGIYILTIKSEKGQKIMEIVKE